MGNASRLSGTSDQGNPVDDLLGRAVPSYELLQNLAQLTDVIVMSRLFEPGKGGT